VAEFLKEFDDEEEVLEKLLEAKVNGRGIVMVTPANMMQSVVGVGCCGRRWGAGMKRILDGT